MLQVKPMMKGLDRFRFHEALAWLIYPWDHEWNVSQEASSVDKECLQQGGPLEWQDVAVDASLLLMQLEAVVDAHLLVV